MIRVKVLGIALDNNNIPIVLLKELDSERTLPIWIGIAEAAAIADGLENKKFHRPLTYDLMKSIINGLDGVVEKVVVSDLVENTFYAKIYLIKDKKHRLIIDARPSDSIALAVRTGAPIFVEDVVMEESGRDDLIRVDKTPKKEKTDFDIKQYLQDLKPEDFGRYDLGDDINI